MKRTEEAAIPTVAVIFPKEGAPTQEIILPGNTQAFSDAPLYARTSGYLQALVFSTLARMSRKANCSRRSKLPKWTSSCSKLKQNWTTRKLT